MSVDKIVKVRYLDYMSNAVDIGSMASMTIKDIPPEVISTFKAWCSMQQTTVKQALIDYMKAKGDTVRIETDEEKKK
ncbi:hypothetical protein ES705_17565 [subsurface metagenome]